MGGYTSEKIYVYGGSKGMKNGRFITVLIALILVIGVWTSSSAQTLTWLGTLGNFGFSDAYAVSADGSVVVGWSNERAFRWTASEGMRSLGTLRGGSSVALGVSADGSVVVGWSDGRAYRWTPSAGMQSLGTLAGIGGSSTAWGVSADGSVVVGESNGRAFRWTESGGMQDLGAWLGSSVARAVSADGSVIVGWSGDRGFRLTPSELHFPFGLGSRAYAVSADGSVVVGGPQAFRWTRTGGMQYLAPGVGAASEAFGVSADGSVVVGWINDSRYLAFRWTLTDGLELLNQKYAHLLSDGSVLGIARAVSADGRYIVGAGYNARTGRNEAFLLDTQPLTVIPEPTTLSLFALGAGAVALVRRRKP